MSKKRVLLISLILVILCLVLALNSEPVSANTIAVTTPVTTEIINGTYFFSATMTSGVGANITNITWSYRTGTTGAFTIFNSSLNTSAAFFVWNVTHDVSTWDDGTTYQLNITGYSDIDGTNMVNHTTITGLLVDNTPAVVDIMVAETILEIYDLEGIEVDCSRSTDTIDSALSAIFYLTDPNAATFSHRITNVTNPADLKYTFENQTFDYDIYGVWLAGCTVYDDVAGRNTASSNISVTVGSSGKITERLVAVEEVKEAVKGISRGTILLIGGFIVVIIVLVLLYFVWWK